MKIKYCVSIAALSVLGGYSLIGSATAAVPCWSGMDDGLIGYSHSHQGLANGLDIEGDYAYVADFRFPTSDQSGILQIFDISSPCSPIPKGLVTNPGAEIWDLDVVGNYAFAAADTSGLAVFDISDVDNPMRITNLQSGSYAIGMNYEGGDYMQVAYSYSNGGELVTYDVSQPASLSVASVYSDAQYNRHSKGLRVIGNRAYHILENGAVHLEIVDVSDPYNLSLVSSVGWDWAQYGSAGDIEVHGNHLYVNAAISFPPGGGTQTGGLRVYDISDETNPFLVRSIDLPDPGAVPNHAGGLVADGDRLFLVSQTGLYIWDISNPADPQIIINPNTDSDFRFPVDFGACQGGLVRIRDNLAFVTSSCPPPSKGGLAVYKLPDLEVSQCGCPDLPADCVPGPNFFCGTNTANFLYGTAADETFCGYGSINVFYAYAGNDCIASYSGRNYVYAGDGDDRVLTGDGSDIVYADNGNDHVEAGEGWDIVYGGSGDDFIDVGTDGYLIYGQAGIDECSGAVYSYGCEN